MEPQTTSNQKQQSNVLLYVLIATIVILLGYIGYVYSANDMLKKGTLKSDYVLKERVNFDMLPEYEQGKYIEFYNHNQAINEITNKLNRAEKKLQTIKKPKVVEKIVEVEKIVKVPVEKIMPVPIVMPAEYKNSLEKKQNRYDTFTCKTMHEGGIVISKSCIKRLHAFLDENKDAKTFEVIGMVDGKDFRLINSLKDVYGEKKIKNLSKYSQIGLSRQRVIEASWVIKEYVGDYDLIKTVNYTINTKNKKGFVVRAYH